ncbi:MAG: hypothetical protein MZU95_13020 [Desulfomicrobium escambiense]|nr:hypothetical protein [Desulfomicrobium escambiense]
MAKPVDEQEQADALADDLDGDEQLDEVALGQQAVAGRARTSAAAKKR